MNQAEAKRLLVKGGFLILLDVPEGTEFGIDLKSWNTGEKFRGVKMIPPGIHYVFYSSVSNTGDTAPRIGFFHEFKKGEFYVKKWDKTSESVSLESVSQSEIVGLKYNIEALDQFLGPYPQDIWEKWKFLSSNISQSLLEKLVPLTGEVRSALELQPCSDANRPRGGKSLEKSDSDSAGPAKKPRSSMSDDELLPSLIPKEGTELRFTEFPKHCYPEGASPSEVTRHSLDSSYLFEKVLENYEKQTDVLGELQFCYICFLVGHSLEAFEHWKKIFSLFCSCESAITKHRRLYEEFLSIVEIQIQETPVEFLADIVANNNFVYVKLRELFRSIRSSSVDGQLKGQAVRLKKLLSNLYQWDFSRLEAENDDEAPVIVEL